MLRILGFSCALLALAPAHAQIDFIASDGPERTCARFKDAQPRSLRTDADRVAFDMVREAATGVQALRAA